MNPVLREALRLGRSGRVSRTLGRAAVRVVPVRGVDLLAYGIIGKPRKPALPVLVRRDGVLYELQMSDEIDRGFFLGLFEERARRVVLSVVRPGDLVLDAGANYGLYTLGAAARGADVLAFEPVATTCARLARNLELNPGLAPRVSVHGVALSDREGVLRLTSESLSGFSGHASAYATEGETVEVPSRRLDDVAGVNRRARLMKIDVEGSEADVLRGASRILAEQPPEWLFVEVDDALLRRAGTSAREVVEDLAQRGYRPVSGHGHQELWPARTTTDFRRAFGQGYAESVRFRHAEALSTTR